MSKTLKTLSLLLPALLPSWRFFDWIAPSPRIEYRVKGDDIWHDYTPRPDNALNILKRLFWNETWNDYLYVISCAERYIENPTDHSHQEIVKRLKRHAPNVIMFRLSIVTPKAHTIAYKSGVIT